MFRFTVPVVALALVGFAGGASAQTTTQRQPAAVQQPATTPSTTGQTQRRRERPAGQTTQTRTAGQPAQARQTPPGQQPTRQSGGLNLDLGRGGATVNGATRRPGDAFAVSGPYASDAQMQRYTGRRTINMPRAPIQMFQTEESDNVTGFRRAN